MNTDMAWAAVQDVAAEIFVTRWTPAWSLDVARSDFEIPHAAVLLQVDMPLVGGRLSVHQHADGTVWVYPDGRQEFVPFGVSEHVWRVPGFAAFRTFIRSGFPDDAQDAWHGLVSLREVCQGVLPGRGLEVVQALLDSLQRGVLCRALWQGATSFERGDDVSPQLERLVTHAFEVRVLLPDALQVMAGPGVDTSALHQRLGLVDELHAAHGSALQLIPDERYDNTIEHVPVDYDAWWGSRARLDKRVPSTVVEGALCTIADTQ